MNLMKNLTSNFLTLVIGVLLGALLFSVSCSRNSNQTILEQRDTFYVHVPVIKTSKPDTIIRYVRDTVLRTKVENEPIVLKVEENRSHVYVSKIDTKGLVTTDVYKQPLLSKGFVVDNSGNLEFVKKKKTWVFVASAATLGTLLILIKLKKIKSNAN